MEYDPLLDSSNIGPKDWCSLVKLIERHYYDYDGFVVIHGTDTMAYTASAMSFMLEGLGKTVRRGAEGLGPNGGEMAEGCRDQRQPTPSPPSRCLQFCINFHIYVSLFMAPRPLVTR